MLVEIRLDGIRNKRDLSQNTSARKGKKSVVQIAKCPTTAVTLHLNISMLILQIVLYTFTKALSRRIELFNNQEFHLFFYSGDLSFRFRGEEN